MVQPDRAALLGLAQLLDELRHLRAEDVGRDVVRVRAWGSWKPKDREERDVPVPATEACLLAQETEVCGRDR